MKNTNSEKYLGMIIDHFGSNKHNIEAHKNRGLYAVNEICSILDNNWFGSFYFQVLTLKGLSDVNVMVTF